MTGFHLAGEEARAIASRLDWASDLPLHEADEPATTVARWIEGLIGGGCLHSPTGFRLRFDPIDDEDGFYGYYLGVSATDYRGSPVQRRPELPYICSGWHDLGELLSLAWQDRGGVEGWATDEGFVWNVVDGILDEANGLLRLAERLWPIDTCVECGHGAHASMRCTERSEWADGTVIRGEDVSGEDAGPCVCDAGST